MSGQGWLCATCTRSQATSFCTCGGRETFLCESCFIPHYQNAPLFPHLKLPIGAYGQHKTPGYLERLQIRASNVSAAKAEIQRNIAEVDRCIAEVLRGTEAIIAAVRENCENELTKLRDLRAGLESKIQEAIFEVESTLYQELPAFAHQLASDIRSYDGNPEKLKYFDFRVDPSIVTAQLASFCNYTTGEDQMNLVLPGIRGNILRLYNIENSKTRTLTLPREFSDGIRLCLITNIKLLIVGSTPASTTASIFNTFQSHLAEIQPMRTARRMPGLIVAEGAAYVFGGQCVECEKYLIAQELWSQLPNSHGKMFAFNPCRVGDEIYLFDACIQNYEIFDLRTQTFHPLKLKVNGLKNNSLSVFAAGEILIVTFSMQAGHFRPGDKSINVMTVSGTGEHPISQCQPVLFGKEVYYVSWQTGNLNSFDLETRALGRKN